MAGKGLEWGCDGAGIRCGGGRTCGLVGGREGG